MVKRPFVLLLTASIWAFAQGTPEAGQITGSASTAVAQSPPPSSTTVSMRGTIQKYDPSTRILSISTPSAIVQFPLASTARIRQGWHKIDASDLEQLSGYRAAVRYLESRGSKIVESIHVLGKSERAGR